tara:strand:+ start:393 stop:647 length:255 start_codon:yes stop_codon:yes gene_type:complete
MDKILDDFIIDLIYEYDGRYKMNKNTILNDIEIKIKWWDYLINNSIELYNANYMYMDEETRKYYCEEMTKTFSEYYFNKCCLKR